jgi:hypothetical protein
MNVLGAYHLTIQSSVRVRGFAPMGDESVRPDAIKVKGLGQECPTHTGRVKIPALSQTMREGRGTHGDTGEP